MVSFCKSPLARQLAVVIVANLSVICTGIFLIWSSPILVKLKDPEQSPLGRPITDTEGAWIVSIGSLLGIFVNVLTAMLLDRIGRKNCLILAAFPKLVAGFLFIFASELWMLLLGRAISGLSDIMNICVVPIYATEIADTKVRGGLGSMQQIMMSLGFVIMLSMGPFTGYIPLNIIITVIAFVAFVPVLFLPETPYYLYTKGKEEEALKVLIYLRGSEALAHEEMKGFASNKPDVKVNRREIIKNRTFWKALLLGGTLAIGAVLSGINAVNFYLQTILESTQTSVAPEIASVVIGLIQLIASVCSSLVTDRFGRKPILIVTLVGMIFGMGGLGFFFWLTKDAETITGFMNFLPLISLILAVFSFSAGLGSVNWALTAELFDGPGKALGLPIVTTISVLFTFLLTNNLAAMTSAFGDAATYWLFAGISAVMVLFVTTCVPETKGKTFAEIQAELSRGAKKKSDEESMELKS